MNWSDYDNRTALMVAAHEGHEQVVRFLLEAGADAGLKDSFGNTAMWVVPAGLHVLLLLWLVRCTVARFCAKLFMGHVGNGCQRACG